MGRLRQGLGFRVEALIEVPAAMFSIFRCFTDGCNAYDGTPLTERGLIRYETLGVRVVVRVQVFRLLGVFRDLGSRRFPQCRSMLLTPENKTLGPQTLNPKKTDTH